MNTTSTFGSDKHIAIVDVRFGRSLFFGLDDVFALGQIALDTYRRRRLH